MKSARLKGEPDSWEGGSVQTVVHPRTGHVVEFSPVRVDLQVMKKQVSVRRKDKNSLPVRDLNRDLIIPMIQADKLRRVCSEFIRSRELDRNYCPECGATLVVDDAHADDCIVRFAYRMQLLIDHPEEQRDRDSVFNLDS